MKKKIFTSMMMACLLPIGGWAEVETDSVAVVTGALDFTKADSLPTGEGFTWANDTLKLSDLNIEAENENGIVLPDGATIVLSGNNTINFKHTMQDTGAAIKGIGSLAFTGDGTLNINSSYEAINAAGDLKINGGKMEIETTGESSDGSITSPTLLSINNSEINLNAIEDDGIFVYSGTVEINKSTLNIHATEEEGIVCNNATISNDSHVYLYSGAKEAFEPSTLSISDSYVELFADNEPYKYQSLYRNAIVTGITNSTFKALGHGNESALREGEQADSTVLKMQSVSNSWVEGYAPIEIETVNNSFVRTISPEATTNAVHGEYTLPASIEIAEGEELIISENATLTVPSGLTLTNNGTATNEGTLHIKAGGALESSTSIDGIIIDDNQMVGTETIEAQSTRIYSAEGKIIVIAPQPTDVQIISMTGAVVASANVSGQQEFTNLASGVYIVRAGEEIVKLNVAH